MMQMLIVKEIWKK